MVYVILGVIIAFVLADVLYIQLLKKRDAEPWKNLGFDLSLPQLGEDGWYMVFEDDFDGKKLNENIRFGENYDGNREIWTYSPHTLRSRSDKGHGPEKNSYWCDEMVEIRDSKLIIHAQQKNEHSCSCAQKGRFSGGIETRKIEGDPNNNKGTDDTMLFSQAFGYFECRAKVPAAEGMWSAFWLQSSCQRKIGNGGQDGTEIDIFESAFYKSDRNKAGHALLWDGYGKNGCVKSYICKTDSDLYEGFHTYALKWHPAYYVFYVDGKPTWASDAGGVSKVHEFIRLTTEIDCGDTWGPHRQKIGDFTGEVTEDKDFIVDYVKVWQNSNYEKYEKPDSYYSGNLDMKG